MKRLAAAVSLAALAAGCAHPFSRIQPGMTTSEVRAVTVEAAPTQVVPYDEHAQAWFYGPDRCILIVDDRVMLKDVTRTEATMGFPGVGGLSVEIKPACYPPGMQVEEERDTRIFIPGLGGATIKN